MEFALTVVVGLAGMLFHFYKRKLRKQSIVGLKDYILGHPYYTVMAVAGTLAASIPLQPDVIPPFTDFQALIAVFTPIFLAGYACDSAINKEVEESPEQ